MSPRNISFITYSFLLTSIFFLIGCTNYTKNFISYNNSKIEYSGRIDSTKTNGVQLYWSGSSIKLNFKGSSISTLIKDDTGNNYYNIIVDGKAPFIFRPDTIKKKHLLATNLSEGKHAIEIFKRTEYDKGTTIFYGFQIGKNCKVLPKTKSNNRKIEFYGNSITSGYAVNDFSGRDLPDSVYTNNYDTYAAITARHFKAKYHCISKSGVGVSVSWFPEIMPDIYNRLNPNDTLKKWDFSSYTPSIVVVNLLQNDSWLVNRPNFKEFKKKFGNKAPTDQFVVNAYQNFIAQLRNHYPNAHIICTLGCMDAAKKGSKWLNYIQGAVTKLNDKKMYTHFMPYIKANAHPSVEDHKIMANHLISFIEKNIDW